jgi:hypothetical protein
MFENPYEISNGDQREIDEQWEVSPAHLEELPSGLIADEI